MFDFITKFKDETFEPILFMWVVTLWVYLWTKENFVNCLLKKGHVVERSNLLKTTRTFESLSFQRYGFIFKNILKTEMRAEASEI